LWSGGGVVFGPRPQDFSQKINQKVKNLALRRAFFDRAAAGEIDIIERFEANPVKTKVIDQIIGRIAPEGKVLIVDASFSVEVSRAARNIERISIQDATQLNTLDLCQFRKVILSEKALDNVLARMNGGN
jgi:large subunit ribosomal protein L4